jgi:hypothetical protein
MNIALTQADECQYSVGGASEAGTARSASSLSTAMTRTHGEWRARAAGTNQRSGQEVKKAFR